MKEALQFLEDVGVLLGEAGPDHASDRVDLIVAARAKLEVLRLAEPSSDFIVTAAGISWGSRPLEVEGAAWLDRLRDDGVAVLAPPNDEAGFGRWIAGLAAQVGTETDARTLELVGVTSSAASEPATTPTAPQPQQTQPVVPTLPPSESKPDSEAEVLTSQTVSNDDPARRMKHSGEAGAARSIQAQVDRVQQLHEAASQGYSLSFPEASGIVACLAGCLDQASLSARSDVICTLDEYTTLHSVNTALLSMKLAIHLGFEEEDVTEIGIAGLLHDIGKVRLGDLPSVSRQMLSGDERGILQSHTAEGARLLLDAGASFAIAAIVAYEHHMPCQGEGGYPTKHFDRPTHEFTRIVAVCDAFDVLRGERSFRPALSSAAALKYLGMLGTQGLDPAIVGAFVELARTPLPRVDVPTTRPPAEPHEIGWLPETGYDPDCEPRPVRF